MALSFQFRAYGALHARSSRVVLFPGAWNPPTIAHAAIARAALGWAPEVVWVLPRAFPHKGFEGAAFDQRRRLLLELAEAEPAFSVALSDGGLYLEIAREAREFFGPEPEIGLLCGRDAAERIASWDYGRPGVFEEMLARHPLLVAARAGEYRAESGPPGRIVALDMGTGFDDVSSTEVRRRISRGEPWQHLVPSPIVRSVGAVFAPGSEAPGLHLELDKEV